MNNEQEESDFVEIIVSNHMNFVGQRADKAVVVGLGEVRNGVITKDVERYTITCPDCDTAGRYDQRGEIVCEDCGFVLSDRPATIATEYSNGRDNTMGQGRGLEKMSDAHSSHEPS